MKPARALLIACLAAACAGPAPGPQTAPMRGSGRDANSAAGSALYEVFVRDFSPAGNFQGVIAGLDRIQATGADVVWLMPIHPVGRLNRKDPLGSSYSVTDYRAINPDYGTAADFRALLQAVHARGMRLIIDWVPNHTAWDHVWVTRHPDFYVRDAQGRMSVPRDNQGRLTDWTDVADLDYSNPALRRAMIDAMRYWLDQYGIDGFRVDVASMVPDDFWREAIPQLRAGKNILLLAEAGELQMHELGFDLTYAWDSYARLKAVWKGDSSAQSFVSHELEDMRRMPPGGRRLRFTTNHDETAWDAPPVTLFGGPVGARAAYVAATLLPGTPLLYNGQEIESPQRLGLFVREPITWSLSGADTARAFYRRVIALARSHAALAGTRVGVVGTDAASDVISFSRGDTSAVLVFVNSRNRTVSFNVSAFPLDGARDLLGGRRVGGGPLVLPPYGVLILQSANSR